MRCSVSKLNDIGLIVQCPVSHLYHTVLGMDANQLQMMFTDAHFLVQFTMAKLHRFEKYSAVTAAMYSFCMSPLPAC